MTAARELQNGTYEPSVLADYDVLEEFFSDAFEYKGKQRYEKGFKVGLERARVQTLCVLILKNYLYKYGIEVPETTSKKIREIDCYPALEEIQAAVWLTPSPDDFERRVNSIIERYAEELEPSIQTGVDDVRDF